MSKVFIITYYWPPTGGGGVYRWLKFAKYLPEYGWEPIIYTPKNPHRAVYDFSLMNDIPENSKITIIKKKIFEPYILFNFLTGRNKNYSFDNFVHKSRKQGGSILDKIGIWLRGNLFIPDARCLWIKPSVCFLNKFLSENPVDVIVSTGTPHSMHLIGLNIAKRLNIPWLADFRDPWTNIDFYHKLMLTKWADRKHRKLESKVLRSADVVTTVSWSWAKQFKDAGAKKVEVITNGYDNEDFSFLPVEQSHIFTISHVGVMNADRNPTVLWKVLGKWVKKLDEHNETIKLIFLGATDYRIRMSLQENDLLKFAEFIEYEPHQKALVTMASSAVLLLVLNNTPDMIGRIPGKMYEYLASKRPILLIGSPQSDSAKILSSANAGYVVDYEDEEGTLKAIEHLWHYFKSQTYSPKSSFIEQFERRKLTQSLVNILEDLKKLKQ